MCLSPKYIENPELRYFRRHVKEVHFLRNWFYYTVDRPFYAPAPAEPITEDTYDRYYLVTHVHQHLPMYIPVPCGHCEECAAKKQSDIRVRMILEQLTHTCLPLFLTLTYSDEYLPPQGVNKEDVQLFFKRFRINYERHYGVSLDFRYCCFSEYGSQRRRPHYHMILFGIPQEDFYSIFYEIRDSWNKGFIHLKTCDCSKFNYVSKYVCKDSFLDSVPDGKNPNFWLASRGNGGIGSPCVHNEDFLIWAATDTFPRITVKVLGRLYEIFVPSYIRNKLVKPLRELIPKEIRDELSVYLRSVKYYSTYSRVNPLIEPWFNIDDFDYLREKYFMYSWMFDEVFDSDLFDKETTDTCSPDVICEQTRCSRSIIILKSFDVPIEDCLFSEHFRVYLSRRIKDIVDALDLPPADIRRQQIIAKALKRYSLNLDSQ